MEHCFAAPTPSLHASLAAFSLFSLKLRLKCFINRKVSPTTSSQTVCIQPHWDQLLDGDTMAMKHTSPAARLLRHSRLFSLPPPLPRPSTENTVPGWTQDSDTATLPYPTHASLETTKSALGRGDWGLKRPLPLKSTTNTSTPIFRVKAIDTIDHVTDYEPSVDHALALQKFQEMNIPIRVPKRDKKSLSSATSPATESVFEDRLQSTERPKKGLMGKNSRWKFEGPWLAGMDRSEFDNYMQKQIRRRRGEFHNFLRKALKEQRKLTSQRTALERGEEWTDSDIELTNEEFQKEIARLRHTKLDLWRLIWEFLDLPGDAPQATEATGNYAGIASDTGLDLAPPSTHRSAGLSYIRANSYVANHPIFGPIPSPPPVEARVMISPWGSTITSTVLGIGGFIGDFTVEVGSSVFRDRDFSRVDAHVYGGPKKWIETSHAEVNSKGRVVIGWAASKPEYVAIWENKDIQVSPPRDLEADPPKALETAPARR